jgi:hypothetical protein
VSAAKQIPHRPGTAPVFGLRGLAIGGGIATSPPVISTSSTSASTTVTNTLLTDNQAIGGAVDTLVLGLAVTRGVRPQRFTP